MAQHRQQFGSLALGDQVGIRIPSKIQTRIRRPVRPGKPRRLSPVVVFFITLSLGLLLTFLAFHRLSKNKENDIDLEEKGVFRRNSTVFSKELKFGHGSGSVGRDSRYWDRDDRRRDQDYEEIDVLAHPTERKDHEHDQEPKKEGKERNAGGGLYNEGGRAELETYKEEYENSLKMKNSKEDEYDDDGIDAEDEVEEQEESKKDVIFSMKEKVSSVVARNASSDSSSKDDKSSSSGKRTGSKRKPIHHKFSGSSCQMKFLNYTAQLVEPVENRKFSRFLLQYVDVEERPSGSMNWEPKFAGHQNLREREESFYARDQKINCGFVKGPEGSPSTGFDLAEDDVRYMKSCHIAVLSCIFGNSDHLRTPYSKLITRQSRKNVCFVIFMDERTLQTLSSEGQKMDNMGYIGLWKIIVC